MEIESAPLSMPRSVPESLLPVFELWRTQASIVVLMLPQADNSLDHLASRILCVAQDDNLLK